MLTVRVEFSDGLLIGPEALLSMHLRKVRRYK